MKSTRTFCGAPLALGAALALASLLPANSQAAQIVNAVVAAPSLIGANSVDGADWLAESFALASAATIDSIAVQVLDADPGSDAGQSFLLAVYGSVNGLPGLNFNAPNQGQLFSTSLSYTADGWTGASGLQWQLPAGNYWLAVEAGSDAGAVTSLVLPTGAQPAPAGVAFYSGSNAYAATGGSDAFGLRIDTVAAVPEPSTAALLLLGLGVFVAARARPGKH